MSPPNPTDIPINGESSVTTSLDYLGEAVDALGDEINAINAANGWDVLKPGDWDGVDKHLVPSKLALLHSEVSEALEAYRSGDLANFAEEMADTLIRVLDITHGLGVDLAGAVTRKIEKNRTRGHRHGGKRV